jgi:hypothetical protein
MRVILLEYFFVVGLLPAGPVNVCGSLTGRWKEMHHFFQSDLLFRSCPYFHELTKMIPRERCILTSQNYVMKARGKVQTT